MIKSIRYIDNQGRIVLPSHIRKALNLGPGWCVEVTLDDDNTIRIRPTKERCSICGEPVGDKGFTELSKGQDRKLICYSCAQAVAKAMLK